MRLPKERVLFVVDLLPVGQVPGRGMIDFYPLEAESSIKQILAMDWDQLIPGHPGVGDRLGHEEGRPGSADVPAGCVASGEAGGAARGSAGSRWRRKCRLPKYEKWPGYEANLQFVLRRYCGLWGRGT